MKKQFFVHAIAFIFLIHESIAQGRSPLPKDLPKVLYGTASFYSNKFEGRQTANGEIFSQQKMTAACNVLPFGTWVKVTNLKNGRSVVVKINDRLHYKMKRVVDLSKVAARQIGHRDGLTRVKVEVVERKKAT
jgi:peptidoglycan lytic transglycosylase